jgi:hypothetical protein
MMAETSEAFTVEVKASDLPESVISRFSRRPTAETRFALTVEPVLSEAERLEALRRDVQEGLDASAAGQVSDGDAVFARLRAKFPAA